MNLSKSSDGIAAEMWDDMGGDTPGPDFEFYARKILALPWTGRVALASTCCVILKWRNVATKRRKMDR